MADEPRGWRFLLGLFGIAVAVSVVHYLDNYLNYADYPTGDIAGVPAPPDWLIAAAWFMFTAFGLLGIWLYRRGTTDRGALLLALYSGSGLVGIGHYLVDGAGAMPWWRHTHVVADIVCAVLLLGFALWAVTGDRRRRGAPAPRMGTAEGNNP